MTKCFCKYYIVNIGIADNCTPILIRYHGTVIGNTNINDRIIPNKSNKESPPYYNVVPVGPVIPVTPVIPGIPLFSNTLTLFNNSFMISCCSCIAFIK